MKHADFLPRVIHNFLDELTTEHVQTWLPNDTQERTHARGPTSVEQLKHCIREYQLQRTETQSLRGSTSTRVTQFGNSKRTEGVWRNLGVEV